MGLKKKNIPKKSSINKTYLSHRKEEKKKRKIIATIRKKNQKENM